VENGQVIRRHAQFPQLFKVPEDNLVEWQEKLVGLQAV
jgi:hypothetical protein